MDCEADMNARWHLGCPRNALAADGRHIAGGEVSVDEARFFFLSRLLFEVAYRSGDVLTLQHTHTASS